MKKMLLPEEELVSRVEEVKAILESASPRSNPHLTRKQRYDIYIEAAFSIRKLLPYGQQIVDVFQDKTMLMVFHELDEVMLTHHLIYGCPFKDEEPAPKNPNEEFEDEIFWATMGNDNERNEDHE